MLNKHVKEDFVMWLHKLCRIVFFRNTPKSKFARKLLENVRVGFRPRKSEKSLFSPKILEFIGDIGVILNDFWSRFYLAIKIWVKFILVENFKIPGIQPIYAIIWRHFRSHAFWGI